MLSELVLLASLQKQALVQFIETCYTYPPIELAASTGSPKSFKIDTNWPIPLQCSHFIPQVSGY
jgi:hypothetical protein